MPLQPRKPMHPGLQQKQRGQQVGGGDSSLLHCHENQFEGMCSALRSLQKDTDLAQEHPEEGHEEDQRAGAFPI